jgi:cyclase
VRRAGDDGGRQPQVGGRERARLREDAAEAGGGRQEPRRRRLTDEERAAYASDASLVERYLADAKTLEVVFPDLAVDRTLVLERGGRTIEVRHLGRGHTASDLVVWLPKERVAIVGDLVSWPVPLVGTTSHPADFAATLDELLSMNAFVFVPGHGPVMKDDAYVRLVARLVWSIRTQTEAAVARGETLEQARKSVDLSEFRQAIAGDSRVRQLGFDNYVAEPGVAVAYREAKEKN